MPPPATAATCNGDGKLQTPRCCTNSRRVPAHHLPLAATSRDCSCQARSKYTTKPAPPCVVRYFLVVGSGAPALLIARTPLVCQTQPPRPASSSSSSALRPCSCSNIPTPSHAPLPSPLSSFTSSSLPAHPSRLPLYTSLLSSTFTFASPAETPLSYIHVRASVVARAPSPRDTKQLPTAQTRKKQTVATTSA